MREPIDLNDVTLNRVFEWQGPLMTRAQLIPDSNRADWEANRDRLVPTFWDPDSDQAWLSSQAIIAKSNGKTLLIDAGIGNHKTRPFVPPFDHLDTGFLDRLEAAGANPDSIDIVINTHLHVDHVGWNTRLVDGHWQPTFPNATYLLPRADFDYWNPEGDTPPPGGLDIAPVFADSVLPVVHAGLAQFYEGPFAVDEHVLLEPAPGHSPGCAVARVTSGGENLLVVGDVLHTPMEILQPSATACFDDDPTAATRTRMQLLERAATESTPLLSGHFPLDRAALVTRSGGGYGIKEWVTYE